MTLRRRLPSLGVVVACLVSTFVIHATPVRAASYRLGMITGTFTTRVNERLIFTVSPPSDSEIAALLVDPGTTALVQMSRPLATRADVVAIVAGGQFASETETAIPGPLFSTVEVDGSTAYQIIVATSTVARRDGTLRVTQDGLRVVRITATAPSGSTAQLTTFINVVSSRSTPALPVTMFASIDGAPALQPDGNIVIGEPEAERLRDLRDLLFRKPPGVPIGVRIRPELVNGLSRSTDESSQNLFAELSSRLPDNDVLVGTFRPTDVASYAAAGLKSQFEAQLLRGETVLDAINGPRLPSRAMWLTNVPIDAAGIDLLRTFGVTNVVAVGDAVTAYGADTNPSRPYALRSATNGVVLHLADTRYSTLLDEPIGTAYESATALAAEIIAQRNEIADSAIGSSALAARHVIIASASGVPAEPLIASILLRHLRNAPQISLRRVGDFTPTLEGLAKIEPPTVPVVDIAGIQGRTNEAVGAVESVRDVVATNDGVVERWIELIDVANDTTLSDELRNTYLESVLTQVASIRGAVSLPTRSFTFGSRDSQLRVPLVNLSDFAVSVRLKISSPTGKMSFLPNTLDVVIPAGAQEEVIIEASARANGLIPIEVALLTPNGTVLDVAQVRVRVNAIAGLGRGVSAVFLSLLAAWWIIHTRRAHKKKKSGQHPALRSQS